MLERLFFADESWWFDCALSINLLKNIKHICRKITTHYISDSASIEDSTIIREPVFIGENVEILGGSYIRGPVLIGPGSRIGPHANIRPNTIIGSHVEIGFSAEIKESIILDYAKIPHFCYVGHSIVGRHVNIAAGVVISVRRFDSRSISIYCDGKAINTNMPKVGAVIGDYVQIGVGVKIMPGTRIGPHSIIYPNLVVSGTIGARSIIKYL